MPISGTQCILCDLPVRYDTYDGCTHACAYCFAQRKKDIGIIRRGEGVEALRNFINGRRTNDTNWCDWNIPIHFGGMSDPFQPVEAKYKYTLQALKVFAQSKYPVVISTKGKLCVEGEWLETLRGCNVVMQISAVCPAYDKLETGAPSFDERVEMIRTLSQNVQRVNVRVQPYMHEVFKDVRESIKRFADAGAYGVIFEGMKFFKKQKGLVKIGGDYCYPIELLKDDFYVLREDCHKAGLKFFAGENRLRYMGDDLTCCGIMGLEGFVPNRFNLARLTHGEIPETSPAQQRVGSAGCFQSMFQESGFKTMLDKKSFAEEMVDFYKERKDNIETMFGIGGNAK